MNVVQPIRDLTKIEKMKTLLKQSNPTGRDYILFITGINTGLRISDILKLKVSNILNQTHIIITEQKTGKFKRFPVNNTLQTEIQTYVKQNNLSDTDYLFASKKGENQPIQRNQAYLILNNVADKLRIKEIGTHTLRKTFGYHFYQKTKDIAMLQTIFNHDSQKDTLRYIGIAQDNMDMAMKDFSL